MAFEYTPRGLDRAACEYEQAVAEVESLLARAQNLADSVNLEELDGQSPRLLQAMEAIKVARRWLDFERDQCQLLRTEAEAALTVAEQERDAARAALERGRLRRWFDVATFRWTLRRRCRPLIDRLAQAEWGVAAARERNDRVAVLRSSVEERAASIVAREETLPARMEAVRDQVRRVLEALTKPAEPQESRPGWPRRWLGHAKKAVGNPKVQQFAGMIALGVLSHLTGVPVYPIPLGAWLAGQSGGLV